MGIGFSHGKGSFSYSQYVDFAEKLAKRGLSEFGLIERSDLYPVLVAHSNHTVTVKQLRAAIPAMKKRITRWRGCDNDEYNYDSFLKCMGVQMIKGMEEALAKNEPFEFT